MMRFIVLTPCVLLTLASHGAWSFQVGLDAAAEPEAPREERRIVVVVSTKNPINSLDADQLGRVYLRQKLHWVKGETITVYERPIKKSIRQRFSRKVLKKKPEALREYWMNLQLTRGLKPPKVLRSAKLVKRYLSRVKGGIGYLYEDEVDDTVKELEIIWEEES